ncbi:hypothetical protein D9615_001513 [Tricholomella constricta]|uniref:Uncharacterized protein n=1 Tax=Tricholomella constricta TaxID=117010 RepID=A0A8H5M985_9AGAR|nr:hypothetical protein D9615_001513 [Tricholomella constricta]
MCLLHFCFTVKQEIFISDVTTCFASLKKVAQEFQSAAAMDARLQMAQASVRPSTVTLTANSRIMIAMDFDALVADWDEYLNIGVHSGREEDSEDEDFDPRKSHRTRKTKTKALPPFQAENARAENHTLTEHHDHILSASFDLSFPGTGDGAPGLTSSQAPDFGFDDNFFAASDGLDIGGLADELAQELGWATPSAKAGLAFEDGEMDYNMDFNFGNEQMTAVNRVTSTNGEAGVPRKNLQPLKRKAGRSDKENCLDPQQQQLNSTPFGGLSPATSFSHLLLSQDEQPMPLNDITLEEQIQANSNLKKMKKARLLLDARTELTDDELKARCYLTSTSNKRLTDIRLHEHNIFKLKAC